MNGSASVEPDPDYRAGHARIRVRGIPPIAGAVAFRIRRDDYNEGVFGPGGWQVADALLTPDSVATEGDALLLRIGPAVVQHIMAGVYSFAIPVAGLETTIIWPDLPLLPATAANMVAEPPRAASRVAAPPRPTIQRTAPVTPPTTETLRAIDPTSDETIVQRPSAPPKPMPPVLPPVPDPAPPQRRHWLTGVSVMLVILLIPSGFYGYHEMQVPVVVPPAPPTPPTPPVPPSPTPPPPPIPTPTPPTPPVPPPTPAPTPPAPPGPPDLEHMTALQAVRSGVPPAALLREAQRRLQLGGAQRNDALLLMQAAADRGSAAAHAALGRFYDPNLPHPPEVQADARQAALQYRAAAQGGDSSIADARAALKTALEQQARRGDPTAPMILREFWP